MLDQFLILTKGGIVLFNKNLARLKTSIIDEWLSFSFIEGRAKSQNIVLNNFKFQWTIDQTTEVIFVAIYQSNLTLTYIDDLLNVIQANFLNQFKLEITQFQKLDPETKGFISFPKLEFNDQFITLLKTIEKKNTEQAKVKVPRKFQDTKKYLNSLEASKKSLEPEPKIDLSSSTPNLGVSNKKNKKKSLKKTGSDGDGDESETSSVKSGRVLRQWDGQFNKKKAQALDYSTNETNENRNSVDTLINDSDKGTFTQDGLYEVKDIDSKIDDDYDFVDLTQSTTQPQSTFSKLFSTLTGQHVISEVELLPVLDKVREMLINKNVASEVAEHLCQSVKSTIIGTKLQSFQSLTTLVTQTLTSTITSILTPTTSMDLIKSINQTNSESKPYVLAFIGVNGVGKSTNLSKTCFWLLQNKKRVLIAACDTFRSGAIEQLEVHVNNLKKLTIGGEVELFKGGYGKDSSGLANQAIQYANKNQFDVVLIDTAGRMQNNSSLMKALAKLVSENQPDKIIFVGEALVGNEAVDQLSKFNQALIDYSNLAKPRTIDSIILTKFDTIDDKVGAALSMTFTANAPILFVGTGQTYTDLKKMNINHVVSALLK